MNEHLMPWEQSLAARIAIDAGIQAGDFGVEIPMWEIVALFVSWLEQQLEETRLDGQSEWLERLDTVDRLALMGAFQKSLSRIADLEQLLKRLADWDARYPKGRIYNLSAMEPEKALDAIVDAARAALDASNPGE